ncbi:uncharacterized protein LOC111068795 [Drosophila obscura]|uniref:uncharacterized protein LOC111068795 n=1 Tax=Drosophila obscura TaxID=7282 RepID=UPI001BB27A41|nr:uncharacterized protein LOC111068795 [Drosophila obscura]
MGSRLLRLGCLLLTLSCAVHTAQGLCKESEILTENKGCVDRDTYLERVLQRTWVAEDLDDDKKAAGLGKQVSCRADEILTATGCTAQTQAPRQEEHLRAQVVHSKLQGDQVVKTDGGGAGAADSAASPEKVETPKVLTGALISRPKVVGHNRPRKYVILPGRILQTGRKCRPYEVLASNNRCIRRKVHKPTGKVKHKDHVYGLQLRHRHKNPKHYRKS